MNYASPVGANWNNGFLAFFLKGQSGAPSLSARLNLLPMLVGLLLLVALIAWYFMAPATLDGSPLLLGMAAAARPALKWGRMREPMQPFYNVAVSTTAQSEIPRYQRTVLGLLFKLGGTTFAKSDISRIELFCGTKSIWGPISGTELNDINNFLAGAADQDANWLPLDFTFRNVKEIGGEMIGGLDLTQLDDGKVRVEVQLGSGVSAPTLEGFIVWGQPQGGGPLQGLFRKLIKRTFPQMASGDNYPGVDVSGQIICREYIRYGVATAGVSTASGQGASFANTGNGVMGAITVAAGTRCGRYRLLITEVVANAGRFTVFDPDGRIVGSGNVAVSFVGGGLTFTLADGATDFVAGDGFTIDVLPMNTDGNLNNVEIKKNGDVFWGRTARAAQFEAYRYGRLPITGQYVVDLLSDNHFDSVLDTSDATTLTHKINFTSADTPSFIFELLAPPIQT